MPGSSSPAWSGSDEPMRSDSSIDERVGEQVEIDTPTRQSVRLRGQGTETPPSRRRRRGQNASLERASDQGAVQSQTTPSSRGRVYGRTLTEQNSFGRGQGSPATSSGLGPYAPTANNDSATKPRATARRSGARSRRGATTAMHNSPPTPEPNGGGTTQTGSPAQRGGRPSGPLSSARTRRSFTTRADFRVAESRRMLDGSELPFAVPAQHTHFPVFRGCARYDGFSNPFEGQQFFDCKFYPYTTPGTDPVFAVVGGSEVLVARPKKSDREPMEIIMWNHEEPTEPPENPTTAGSRNNRNAKSTNTRFELESAELNSCVWMRAPITGAPLLAVAGSKPTAIKILDVTRSKLHRTLVGHGKEVNDLAVSPKNASILASASGDRSVRIWNIDPKYEKQPCVAMCVGEGHRQGLLTLAFHGKGRYLLTGGIDCAICLWALPKLPYESSATSKPIMVHYPHFKSTVVHCSYVDCVAFHNDLILSKSAIENKIVLWRIEGFDSREDPPAKAPAISEGSTCSAFGGKFQRIIQFGVAEANSFYIRFSLFSSPSQRPVLAVGNEKSRVLFWDIQALEEFIRMQDVSDRPGSGSGGVVVGGSASGGGGSHPLFNRGGRPRKRGGRVRRPPTDEQRHASILSESSNARSDNPGPGGSSADRLGITGTGKQRLVERYQMNDPFQTLEPHKTSIVQKVNFACRQVAWSVGGEHMVVVGDQGMIALFGRDMAWEK